MAIILACGNKIRIYQVEKSRSTLQCSFISEIDAEASKLGEYATNMNIIEELDGYRNEKIYFILTHGSGVLYKTAYHLEAWILIQMKLLLKMKDSKHYCF